MNLRLAVGQGRTVQFTFLLSRHVQILQGSLAGIHVSISCKKNPKQIVRKKSNIPFTGMLAMGVGEGEQHLFENQKTLYRIGWLRC